MFRMVLPPIIRSAYNSIYNIWYLSHRYCYLPLSWKSWNRFERAVGGVRHVKKRREKLGLKYKKMCWLTGRRSALSVHNKLMLYKQILKPVWTYSIKLWGCTRETHDSTISTHGRVQLKCDGTRWRTGGNVKWKLANGVGSQYSSHYLGTWCIQHYYRWCSHLGCK
jgi:hypothetical protein